MVIRAKRLILLVCFLTSSIKGYAYLEKKPWFYPPYQFQIGTNINPNYFTNVQSGFNPLDYHSNNFDWVLYFLAPFSETFDAQIEVNFKKTTKKNFNFETVVAQIRKQLLDDIKGDWVSLYWGFNYRYVPKVRLGDVATPYHNLSNFEIVGAIGKEFAKDFQWYCRTFLWGAVGQANTGYPWGRFDFCIQGRTYGNYILSAGSKGYFGSGPEKVVNVNQFDSWARIQHQSVDVYGEFAYKSQVWGEFSFRYVYRPYARYFPEHFNAFILSYNYPFSF